MDEARDTRSRTSGLILFLVAGLVTARFGDELGLVVTEGESRTVQNIGTTDLMLVKNNDFEAPGFETGRPTDFTTDLAVYQNGQSSPARRSGSTTRSAVGGYTFHQNGSGRRPTSSSATPAAHRCGPARCR